jgi:hypothetical protein
LRAVEGAAAASSVAADVGVVVGAAVGYAAVVAVAADIYMPSIAPVTRIPNPDNISSV